MIVTVASSKGGVSKTTTAVTLAAVLHTWDSTILFDDDDKTKNATRWSKRGTGFPFPTYPGQAIAMLTDQYKHKIIDSGQGPSYEDLALAAKFSQLLILPAPPSALDTDCLIQTVRALQEIGASNYRVLLTKVPSYSHRKMQELRSGLDKLGAPMFEAFIPRLTAFEKATESGGIVRDVGDPNAGRAWDAYVEVAEELRQWA